MVKLRTTVEGISVLGELKWDVTADPLGGPEVDNHMITGSAIALAKSLAFRLSEYD
jgi:hypothetical protein